MLQYGPCHVKVQSHRHQTTTAHLAQVAFFELWRDLPTSPSSSRMSKRTGKSTASQQQVNSKSTASHRQLAFASISRSGEGAHGIRLLSARLLSTACEHGT
eukprot:159145-Rhodomonas_salina.1